MAIGLMAALLGFYVALGLAVRRYGQGTRFLLFGGSAFIITIFYTFFW